MGNYCCSSEREEIPHRTTPELLKRKFSLEDPHVKKKYETEIGQSLNDVLLKYSGKLSVENIRLKSRLGKGGQGEVFLVQLHCLNSNQKEEIKDLAMKRMSKKKLDAKRTKQALLLENKILSEYQSKFLLQIEYAFQNKTQLFYLMKIAKGGDLYSFIYDDKQSVKRQMFEKMGERGIKFILAGVLLGLNYLHEKGIVYRDLKPQNILIFQDGYPRLADFGVSKKYDPNQKCFDVKGTILYFSPEMLGRRGYDKASDLWALGILLYELLFKVPPFSSSLIKSNKFQSEILDFQEQPPLLTVSDQSYDLLKKLLTLNPHQRIGYYRIEQLKNHQFFSDIHWQKYQQKQIVSPLQPILQQIDTMNNRKTEVINELIQTQLRQDVPFEFVRMSKTRDSEMSPKKYERTSTESDKKQEEDKKFINIFTS